MSDEIKHKVTALSADFIAPAVTMHQMLEHIDKVDTVLVVAYLKNGDVHVGHSSADDSRLIYMAVCADEYARKLIRDHGNDR